jgi:hypothetical protein
MESQSKKVDLPNEDKVVLKLAGLEKKWVHAAGKGWIESRDFTDESMEIDSSAPAQLISRQRWKFWKK